MKRLILLLTLAAVLPPTGSACTGISLTARDGSYVQARTIEWAQGPLDSYYAVIPRGERLRCIDLRRIDFSKVKRQSHPLDRVQEQPVEMVEIK